MRKPFDSVCEGENKCPKNAKLKKRFDVMIEVRKIIILCWGFILCLTSSVCAEGEAQLYRKAVQAAKAGRTDFAFMYYNDLGRDYPYSKYREDVLFVQGEYYGQSRNYAESAKAFNVLIHEYPQSQGRLFALAYLYAMAQREKGIEAIAGRYAEPTVAARQEALSESLKKEILTFKQVGLVFTEFKEYTYRSPLYQTYKAVFHIDKVEFYVGGELFATVAY
jgi:hypothetical protein